MLDLSNASGILGLLRTFMLTIKTREFGVLITGCTRYTHCDHAVGGLPSQRHNHIRDLTATLLSEVVSNVGVEPRLLPLSGEALPFDDQARLDIEAYGFWGSLHERALFDVRVFNPFARSYVTSPSGTSYRPHERAKVREYEQRVREIERASFTPLVFSATGGMAPRAKVFYKKLSDLLAVQRKDNYSRTIALVRAMLNFSLLRSRILTHNLFFYNRFWCLRQDPLEAIL